MGVHQLTLCQDFRTYVLADPQDSLNLLREVTFENKTAFLFVGASMNIWLTPGIYRGPCPIKASETFQE